MEVSGLVKVSYEDCIKALENWYQQKDIDSYLLKNALQKFKDGYKLSWWQRNISKLQNKTAEDFFDHIVCEPFTSRVELAVILGFVPDRCKYTVGRFGSKWREEVETISRYKSEDIYLCSGSVAFVSNWKDHEVLDE